MNRVYIMLFGDRFSRFIPLLLLVFLLGACAKPIKELPVDAGFLSSKGKVALISLTGKFMCELCDDEEEEEYKDKQYYLPHYYIEGGVGIVDYLIIYSNAKPMREALYDYDLKAAVEKHFLNTFGNALELEGFSVTKVTPPYQTDDFPTVKDSDLGKLDESNQSVVVVNHFDFKQLAEKLDTDYVLALDISMFGGARSYASVIPTSDPRGVAKIRVSAYDRNRDALIFDHWSKAATDVQGEWDQPPDFPNFVRAVDVALEKTMDESFFHLFGRAP